LATERPGTLSRGLENSAPVVEFWRLESCKFFVATDFIATDFIATDFVATDFVATDFIATDTVENRGQYEFGIS
jgi:hypothetical protein